MPSLQPILICLAILTFPLIVSSVTNPADLLSESAFAIPYLVLALVAFLGLKMRQRRTLALSLFLMGSYAYVLHHRGPLAPVAVAIPLYLCCCFALHENAIPKRFEFPVFVVAALPSFLVVFFSDRAWMQPLFGARFSPLSDGALILCIVFAATTVFEKDRFVRDFRVFVLLSFVPIFQLLVQSSHRSPASIPMALETAVGFVSTGGMLFYGMFRLYWRKVYLDELTGIPNRRALNEKLNDLKGEYAIVMCDIDHFKRINDTYGHSEGDHVLRFVSNVLEKESGYRVYRYGGEEFCIIWEHASTSIAMERVERIRQKLAAKKFVIRRRLKLSNADSVKQRGRDERTKLTLNITFSAGVSGPGTTSRRAEDAVIAADQALYRAKMMGRNCVILAQQE